MKNHKNMSPAEKLVAARGILLDDYPFYGTLIMHMKFALAGCGTACTDMKRILFDPGFLDRMSVAETAFVLQHEILHCILHHVSRGHDHMPYLYNVACDIVVNSNILLSMGVKEFTVAGEPAMHLTPGGKEGYLYTAEEVYEELLKQYSGVRVDASILPTLDDHDIWEAAEDVKEMQTEWDQRSLDALKHARAGAGSSPGRLLDVLAGNGGRVDWKSVLRDFIVLHHSEYDYTYQPANRNYIHMDLAYPQFNEIETEELDRIHFFIDTSASVDEELLAAFLGEIKYLTGQFDRMNCMLSFFDTMVSRPVSIDGVESVEKVMPVGGGGTDFFCIFDYIRREFSDTPPKGIVILTDGYAAYPTEKDADGIPVLWMICGNHRLPPYGTAVVVEGV